MAHISTFYVNNWFGIRTTNFSAVAYAGPMNPNDILQWPDGFWCFREENDPKFMRGTDFRVINYESAEWLDIYTRRPSG